MAKNTLSLMTGARRKATGVTTLAASGRHILPPGAVTRAELVGSAAALREMKQVAATPAVVVVADKGTAALEKRVVALEAELQAMKVQAEAAAAAAVVEAARVRFFREERVQKMTLREVDNLPRPAVHERARMVETSRWVHSRSAFDPQKAVKVKLPVLQRAWLWLMGR